MPPRIDFLHAALTGFRVTRGHPWMVAASALLFLVSGFITMAATAYYAGPQWSAFWNAWLTKSDLQTINGLATALTPRLAPAVIIAMPVTLASASLFLAAAWRVTLAPEQGGRFQFRLSMDELRQFIVLLLQYLFFMLSSVVMIIASGLVSALVISASPQAGALLAMVLGCAGLALLVIAAVHLSLAGPATFERRRVQVLSIWPLAKHRFWPMAGAYFMAALLSALVLNLGMTISYAPLVLVAGGAEAAAKQPYLLSMVTLFSPLSVLSAVLASIVQALTAVILVTPAADLYRQITMQEQASTR